MVRWHIAAALGVAASVLVTGLALVAETATIEADLAAKAKAVFEPEAMEWASVSISGRDLALSGAAPTEQVRDMAVRGLQRQFGVRVVDAAAAGLLPLQEPYSITLSREGGALTIAGYAPSRPDKRRLVDAFTTAVPNLAYTDDLVLARGMPASGFLDAATGLMPTLGLLNRGTIEIENTTVTIDGEAASNAAYDRLSRAAAALPPGYTLASVSLIRPRADLFALSAVKDASGVVLSGYAPDPNARNHLFGVARTSARDRAVRQTVDLASGAPAGFVEASAEAIEFLGLMEEGRVDVREGVVSVSGVATTPEAYRTLLSHLSTFAPAGFEVQSDVGLPVVRPFLLTVSRAGPKVGASGFVPSEEAMAAIRTAVERVAGLGGGVVETTMAAGAPEGFDGAATFAIGLLENVADGTVILTDDSIRLTGTAATGADLLEIAAAVSSATPAGFTVDIAVQPPRVEDYVWTIERGDEQFTVSGYVPSEDDRLTVRSVVELAAGDDLVVADRTSLASGLPAGVNLPAVAAFAAESLARLDGGRASLEGNALSLSGRTGDAVVAQAIRLRFTNGLPGGAVAGTVSIDAPNLFRFRVERGLDAVIVDGVVPDEATAEAVRDLVRRTFGSVGAEIDLDPVDGLPAGAAAAIEATIRGASLLATGVADIDGAVISVSGKTFTGVGAVRLASDIGPAIPSGFRLDTAVGVAPTAPKTDAAGCSADFDAILATNTVLFDSGSDTISADSHGLLDRLGSVALRCPDAPIVVTGHTDAEGDPAANRDLSERRAAAVARVLATIGVPESRLVVRGVGADEPVADNGTPEGRAQNRRIVLSTTPPAAETEAPDPAAPAAPDPAAPAAPAEGANP